VSHLTWNPPRYPAATAASELPINVSVTMQYIAAGSELRGILCSVSHVIWNLLWHVAAAAGNELVVTQDSRCMLVGGFRVTWDITYHPGVRVTERTFCASIVSRK
jgi:hypothetical protein